ncbi:MAG: hypothetical protein ACRCSK_02340 [Fusobacteriaceae bacterium]
MVDEKLKYQFRTTVNIDYEIFVNTKYKEDCGCLCSCMDWLDFSIDYIKKIMKK